MNENVFTSQRTHTRIKFEPLTTSCSLVCLTPMSPVTQTSNMSTGTQEYEPDRTVSPTVILPDIRAIDPDNVFTHGSANANIALDSIAWTVDGEPIASVWTEGVDYEIDKTATDTRGSLKVMKNLPVSSKVVLHFTCEFNDWRTGINYTAESDDIALSCTEKGASAPALSVDKATIEYDPIHDGLLLYDYKVARGMTVQGTRNDHKDGKSFEQTVTALFTIGTEEVASLPAGYTMQVVKLGTTTPLIPNSVASPEIMSVTFPSVTFDMRQIDRQDYEIQILNGGNVVARAAVGMHTKVTMPTDCKPRSGADISPSQKVYANSVLVNLSDDIVEYPELYYLIKWLTQAKYNDNGVWKYAAEKEWQHGENMLAPISELGIGLTQNDSFFDLFFNVTAHSAQALLTDESGNVLTDENGNYLIG